jgi:hypothetical protein
MKDLIDPIVRDLGGYHGQKEGHGGDRKPHGRVAVTLVVLGLVVALSGVAFLVSMDSRLRRGVAARVRSGDSIEVSGDDRWLRLSPGREVREGARVRTGGTEARLRLRDGEVWIGPQAAARIFSDRIDLIRGEALVSSRGHLVARWADVEVSGRGAFRITPGTNPRVGIYHGDATVRRPGEHRALAALEQLELAARRLPADPNPLAYRIEDRWDQEFLGPAIAFDGEVSRITRGIDMRFSTAPRPPEFYRSFRAFDKIGVSSLKAGARDIRRDGWFGPPSDVLITFFVAEAAGHAAEQTVPKIAQWRARGSRWGLIALRLGLTASDFTQVVDLSQVDRTAGSPVQLITPDPPLPPAAQFTPLPTPRPERFGGVGMEGTQRSSEPTPSGAPSSAGGSRRAYLDRSPGTGEEALDGGRRDEPSLVNRLDRLLDRLVGVLGSVGML